MVQQGRNMLSDGRSICSNTATANNRPFPSSLSPRKHSASRAAPEDVNRRPSLVWAKEMMSKDRKGEDEAEPNLVLFQQKVTTASDGESMTQQKSTRCSDGGEGRTSTVSRPS